MRLMLKYPNGRVRDHELDADPALDVGSEFNLYGRRWRIDRMIPADPWHPEPRWRCTPIGPGPLDRAIPD